MSQIVKGLDSSVHEAQQIFRLLMDAMAKPGLVVEVPSDVQFGEVSAAVTQLLLTLSDNSTPCFLSQRYLNDDHFVENFRFHCAAPITQTRELADFALISGEEATTFCGFAMGEGSYPDKSASIIIEVDSLESGIECLLTGPGIQTSSSANIKGLSDELLMALISGRGTFPQGVDLYLSSGHQIMAIPRTTRIQLSTEEALCTLQ